MGKSALLDYNRLYGKENPFDLTLGSVFSRGWLDTRAILPTLRLGAWVWLLVRDVITFMRKMECIYIIMQIKIKLHVSFYYIDKRNIK